MSPEQIIAAIGAVIGVPLLIIVCKYSWSLLTGSRERVEALEKQNARLDAIVETLQEDVDSLTTELKVTQTQQVRHDERLRNHDNDFKKLEDRFDRIDDKLDMLLNKK